MSTFRLRNGSRWQVYVVLRPLFMDEFDDTAMRPGESRDFRLLYARWPYELRVYRNGSVMCSATFNSIELGAHAWCIRVQRRSGAWIEAARFSE